MRFVRTNQIVAAILIAAGVLGSWSAGCSQASRDPSPDDYVFFSNDPALKQVSASQGEFLYANPRKPLGTRDQFIVNPAQITFQPQSPYWLDAGKSQELANFLRQEVIANLSKTYKVVEDPGPQVLRVSVMLADIRKRETTAGQPQHQPVLIVSIVESDTGVPVALLRDLNRGSDFAALATTDEPAARNLLSQWAGRLTDRLEEARRAASQSTTVEK